MIIREVEANTVNKANNKQGFKKLIPYLFLLPHLIFFSVFVVYPFFYGIVISFTKFDMMSAPKFVGFDNYAQIFNFSTAVSKDFFGGLGHTFFYTIIAVPLIVIVPLLLAVWLYAIKNEKLRNFFQAVLYATSILSVSTVVMIFTWLLDSDNGLFMLIGSTEINGEYPFLWLTEINWRGSQPFAWISIFTLTLWSGVGGNMIIFLSAISSIPKSQYEAANIDGAGAIKKFFRLTLPSLRFPLTYSLITGVIGGFNVFGQPFLFGGPVGTYETAMMEIQNLAFAADIPQAGMASAMSVVLGIIIAIVSLIQFKVSKEN